MSSDRTRRSTLSLIAGAALSAAAVGSVQADSFTQQKGGPSPRYIVFLHTGGAPDRNSPLESILITLLKEGFSVRKPDDDRDVVGGPGIDYFYEEDRQAAEQVADLVNRSMPQGSKRLAPRLQRVKNPRGYLGVWLF